MNMNEGGEAMSKGKGKSAKLKAEKKRKSAIQNAPRRRERAAREATDAP